MPMGIQEFCLKIESLSFPPIQAWAVRSSILMQLVAGRSYLMEDDHVSQKDWLYNLKN